MAKKPTHHPKHHAHHEPVTHEPLKRPFKFRSGTVAAVIVLVALIGTIIVFRSLAASDSLSLAPASSSPALGSNFAVTIHENSNTDAVNAVEADLTYDTTKFQFVSIDTSTSAFGLQAVNSGGNGTVKIARANSTALTGDQIVAVVNFTAIGAGAGAINFDTTSALVRASDSVNVLALKTGGTYTVVDTTPPTAPSGLTIGARTDKSIAMSWTAATDNVGVTGYKIFRNGSQVGTSATTTFTDLTGLTPSTSYSYTVAAFDAAGNTSAQTAAVATATLADTTAPSTPVGLTKGTVTVTSIGLSWTASTDDIAVVGYKVFKNGTQISTTPSTSFTSTGLTPNTAYTFAVAAYDAAGNTSAQTAGLAASTLADTSAPTVPTGLVSTTRTTNSIGLSWTASTDNVAVTGYKIFRNGTQVGTSATTAFTDTGLSQATSYNYTLAAFDAAGNTSAQTAAASFATVSKPGDINSDGSVNITDLSILATNYGQCSKTFAQGDLNGDSCVDIIDLSILASHWGT